MRLSKGLAAAAITASVLAVCPAVRADASNQAGGSQPADVQVVAAQGQDASASTAPLAALTPTPIFADDTTPAATPAPPAAAPEKPLMYGLDKVGLAKPLKDLGINITGFIEAGYSYDFTVPRNITAAQSAPGNLIFFGGPDKNEVILDQLDLSISRGVDASKGDWDVGFNVEAVFGRDAVFTHSNGILDNHNKHGGGEDDQLDLLQANVLVAVPVGSGITVQAGKFVTLLGSETINPTTNAFYSHSYQFSYGIPFTQTGMLATYVLDPTLTMTAGFTRGWNQSTSDNNGAIDFLGQAIYKFDDKTTFTGNLSVGPEAFKDNSDYFVVPEVIAGYAMSDQLTLTGDFLYGFANSIAQWYGAAGYASYKINDMFTGNLRAEFYHDGHGATTGAGSGSDVNYWAVTAGVSVTPLPDSDIFQYLKIRPEVRYDWADHAAFDFSEFNQLTAAVDVIMQF